MRKSKFAAVAAAVCLILGAGQDARATSQRPMTTNEIIDESEQIFVAVCEGKSSQFRDGNIFTTYKLRPTEVWKGKLALNSDGVVELEELGGSAKGKVLAHKMPGADPGATAPDLGISQYVGGAANMIVGEEVLLFTRTGSMAPQLQQQGRMSPYKPGNLAIVGRTLGRFSVLTDPATGEKFVTRISVEGRGIVPSDASIRGYLNVRQRQLAGQTAPPAPAPGDPTVNTPGIPADELMARLQAGNDALSASIQKGREANARAKSGAALGALTGEIQDFDSLSGIKEKVEKRLQSKAGK